MGQLMVENGPSRVKAMKESDGSGGGNENDAGRSSPSVHPLMNGYKKCVCVCAHVYKMEHFSAIKKNEILPFETPWIDLESIMLSERSQAEKDKQHMISLICEI